MASLFSSSTSNSTVNYSSATDKGLCRGNNEDTVLSIPEKGLWLVADGMGGHEAGEVASAIVRDTVEENINRGKSLSEAIQQAHFAVLRAVNEGIGAAGMGSTVVAISSQNQAYEVAWIGDSRAYLWSKRPDGGNLEQLTTDHSYVQMLLASGIIGEDEVENHPDKNVITQCIGSLDMARLNVDTVHGKWEQEQWILLCSDGLTDEVNDKSIARLLCSVTSPKDAVNALMQAALDSGGHDNISIQVIESPLDQRSPLRFLWDWLPDITGSRLFDTTLYSLALVSMVLTFYWVLT